MIQVKKKLLPFLMGIRSEYSSSQENLRSANELHYEHNKWLKDLDMIKDELIILSKHNKGNLKKDFTSLLKSCIGLQKSIRKHESTLAMAFKACGINDYDHVFKNHKDLDKNLDQIHHKIRDLKFLLIKYKASQFIL